MGSILTVGSMYYVYILYSESKQKFYTGITSDVKRRMKEHNNGYEKSTKNGVPWVLLHAENFRTRLEAREKEKFFKSGWGRELRQQFLKK